MALACAVLIGSVGIKADAARYTIYVNRRTNIVNVVNSVNGKLARSMWCSTGKRYGTIKGTFRTKVRYRWRELFGNVYGQYAVRFQGHYLFHSVPYKSRRKDSVKVSAYNKLGFQDSMGCIRMAVVDEKWIYDHCRLGTKVVVGEARRLVKPTRPLLRLAANKKTSWDPTDPDSRNPYRVKLSLRGGIYATVPMGEDFDIKQYVNVKSKFTKKAELLKNVSYEGKINTDKAGTYNLTVTVKDPATLLRATKTLKFKVRKTQDTAETASY